MSPPQCPQCSSQDVARSRTRSWLERLGRDLLKRRPYRCRDCSARFFAEGPSKEELTDRKEIFY